jgi:hypothetical protein
MNEKLTALRYLKENSALLGSIDAETWARFEEYFMGNPRVWTYFKRFATYAKSHNKRIGAKAIMERVRWECDFGEEASGTEFKVNNNYTSYYVRLLISQCPEFKGFFELREVHGLKEAA